MVAQTEAISPAQDGQLERKRLTAKAIRRGELSISAPIEAASASAGVDALEQPASTANFDFGANASAGRAADGAPHALGEVQEVDAEDPDLAPAAFEEQPPLRHKSSSLCIRDISETQEDPSTAHTSSYNPTGTSFDFSPGTPTKMELKKRRSRSGTLRNVLRKMFGRKRKSVSMAHPVTPKFGHEYHRSDPGFPPGTAVTRANGNGDDESRAQHSHQRILSLPIQEAPRKSPIRTLPFPMNVNAPQEPSPQSPHNYLSFETAPQVHRRRATLPSVVLSQSDVAALTAVWNQSEHQISPELAAFSPTLSNSEIGLAVTSGTVRPAGVQKRRSRSVGDLPLMVKQYEQEEMRRRSAEIKSWHQSFQPLPESQHASVHDEGSVYSRKEDEGDEQDSRDVRPSTSPNLFEQIAEMDVVSVTGEDGPTKDATTYEEGSPDQAFFSPASKYQHRSESPEPPPNVDARLSKLEDNLHFLEQSLHKLSGRSNRHTIIIGETPARPRTPSSSGSCHTRDRSHDRNDSATVISSSTPQQQSSTGRTQSSSTHSSPRTQDDTAETKSSRRHLSPTHSQPSLRPPTAATTIASGTGASSIMSTTPDLHVPQRQPSPSMIDHLAPLYNALRYERNVRKQLEQQVLSLQRGVLELQATVHELRTGQALVGSASAGAWQQGYPTPSSEYVFNRSRFSGLGEEDDNGDEGWHAKGEEKERGRDREGKKERSNKKRGRRKANNEGFVTPAEEVIGEMF